MHVQIPIFETSKSGNIIPNYAFHRPLDKVHSRCIEYPWAASKYSGEKKILDVGSAKGCDLWVKWLSSLSDEVYLTDYDKMDTDLIGKNNFIRSDVRKMPFPDNFFDIIFAVSVLEHIGLSNPQVNDTNIPEVDNNGDIQSFAELIRILKPSGKLIITLPFGSEYKLAFNNSARIYNNETLNRFSSSNAYMEKLDVYKYFPLDENAYKGYFSLEVAEEYKRKARLDYYGLVDWKKVDRNILYEQQGWHIDCVAMGVWIKKKF